MIKNPEYKGKWSAPLIDNPAYKGPWAPRKIANPAYFEDKTPSNLEPMGAVSFPPVYLFVVIAPPNTN
jgi:calnexin